MADFSTDSEPKGMNAVSICLQDKEILTIFTTNYNQKNYCTMIGSPSEKGLTQFDNKVTQPSTVQFTGIVKSSQLGIIRTLRRRLKKINLGDLICQFQTKAGRIENMILESIEEIGESNRYDGVEIKVVMQEYLEHNVASKKG